MKIITLFAVAATLGAASLLAAGPAAAQAAAKKPMTYDCTKAGNKNKAACKTAAPAPMAAAPVAKPMAAPMAKPAAPMARPAAAPMARPAAGAKPLAANSVRATLKNGKTVTYNCDLAGNKSKTACKTR